MRLLGILFQSHHLCIYQSWGSHIFAEKIEMASKDVARLNESEEIKRGRRWGESNGYVWFTVGRPAHVEPLIFSRSYCRYYHICLSRHIGEHKWKRGTFHYSLTPPCIICVLPCIIWTHVSRSCHRFLYPRSHIILSISLPLPDKVSLALTRMY